MPTRVSVTTIGIDKELKWRLNRYKFSNETWDDFLEKYEKLIQEKIKKKKELEESNSLE